MIPLPLMGASQRDEVANLTARLLIEIGAVHFRPHPPFRLTSGYASPVYIDCRKIISYPRAREAIIGFALATLQRQVGFESFDVVAGGETAGIPFAAWLADRLGLPMIYVRKQPKGFGRDAQIEGTLPEGARTLLVEDLATDGRSKIAFARALRSAGGQVNHAFVVFHYGIFARTKEQLAAESLRLHALASWMDVLTIARDSRYFDAGSVTEVEAFLADPAGWSARHGGVAPNQDPV